MLDKNFLQTIKTSLLKERERLEKDLLDLGSKQDVQNPGHFEATFPDAQPDAAFESEDDIATEVTAYADALSLVERISNELRDTNKAIEALDQGTYGICKYCKKDIDQKRLEARPTSSTCIACKKLLTQEL